MVGGKFWLNDRDLTLGLDMGVSWRSKSRPEVGSRLRGHQRREHLVDVVATSKGRRPSNAFLSLAAAAQDEQCCRTLNVSRGG